jgi:type III pantothenate kinase
MKADVVVDVGNTRIKWGRCAAAGVTEVVSLPPADPAAWRTQLDAWRSAGPWQWVVSGVHPPRRDQLAAWLRQQGEAVHVLEWARQLPLSVALEQPDHVGIDRLLNAVAANRVREAGRPAVLIDAGSAVTIDWLDEQGAFRGGSIYPGVRLMARALHEFTALLPLVELDGAAPDFPGPSTTAAMKAGIYYTVAGGINEVLRRMAAADPLVYLTGGDAALLRPAVDPRAVLWPAMTLEGVRLSAEALP